MRLNVPIPILLAVLALAGCRTGEESLPPVGAALVAQEQAACEGDGGRWGAAGAGGLMVCYRPTGDGGKPCDEASDCRGLCLARSRTCAPVTPLFGCNEVLGRDGAPSTVCLE